jgi:uncharacterized protein
MSSTEDLTDGGLRGLRFKVTDLRRRPGSRMTERRVIQPVGLEDSRSVTIGEVRVGSVPATVDVDIESLNDGVRVRATVEYGWEGACRRCLGTARGTTTSEILELFVDDPASYEGSEGGLVTESSVAESSGTEGNFVPGGSGTGEADGEARKLTNGWVDLSESVRDALLLGLPLAPLCTEGCAGPAPEEFPVAAQPDDVATTPVSTGDPRWAALNDLRFDPEGT